MPVLKNGINSLVKNKRPNADTLSSSAIISSILLGKESAALTIMFLEEVSELFNSLYYGKKLVELSKTC